MLQTDLLDWATRGYFGRFSYNYDQKYFLEFNGRYDATSRFRADKRWGFFPSFSGAWNVAKENFWPVKDVISGFKIRGSWATSGNANVNALGGDNNFYLFSPTIPVNQVNNIALGGSTITAARIPAIVPETLTWEKPTSIGIGLDVLAFNNRLELNYDWYQRTTRDQSGPPNPLPEVLGTTPPATNNSESETRGWEVSVKWQDQSFSVLGKPFKYSLSARMNDYVGYVTKYEHNGTGAIGGQWTPGEVFGQNRLYTSNGIIQNGTQLNNIVPHTGTWIYPGDLSIQDTNGDGVINQGNGGVWYSLGDRTLTDSYSYPRYRYGFSLTAEWNNFNISMNADGVGHWKRFSGNQYIWGQGGSVFFAPFFKETTDLGYWTANNPGAFLPRNGYHGKNRLPTDQYLLNLAHLRIRNIRLGYNIPTHLVQKMGLRSLNVYASGENLGFIFYKSFIKLDPQLLAASSGEGYPPSRTFSLGLNIGL
ncbi:TonB-dependent receptor [Sabulilitoribacter arenilitoris]|uniref:TonB-dependent receptor n=1 Tax=Wocania arenilitoris TaxID=2044858 RepID=A0AAE3EMT0_9FLAO|nr:TonB-dependent receptor [Wocania arenilitoris]MCF7567768.1 TonB-dependent receptor [Wocania arenilitoris]